MKKLNRKGFTIVELVIVIAVVAILAAVLIPTFGGLIKTAQTSADVSLVKNVNLLLSAERTLEGKNETMQEALDDAFEGGYDITKLSPTNSDNLILWDQVSDNFVLYANGKYNDCGADVKVDTNALYKLWNIADNTDGSDYSVYYTGEETTVNVNGVGFDAGKSNVVANVKYENTTGTGKDVLIRTNGGALTVNAPADTVKHYGSAELVEIEQVSTASYHEYGEVNLAKIANGRIVVTEAANLGGIHAVATGTGNNAYFNDIVVGVVGNATIPSITRDRVAIDDVEADGKYSQFVLEVQSLSSADVEATEQNKDYVWINVTIESGAKTGVDALVVSDTAATESTKTLNTGDNVQVPATETPSSAASSVASKTESAVNVSNAKELSEALQAKKKYIVFKNDIIAEEAMTIDGDVIIDGANHKLTTTGAQSSFDVGEDNTNFTVTIKNLTINGSDVAYSCGLNIKKSYVTVNVYDCTITAGHYPINVSPDGDHLKMNISGSEISGYCALNVWAFYNEITVSNSTLTGTNNSTGIGNSFSTICFESDTTFSDNTHGYNSKITVKDSTINAIENKDSWQTIVGFNGGNVGAINCIFETENCTFNSTNKHAYHIGNNGRKGNSWINNGEEQLDYSVDISGINIASDGNSATGTIKLTVNNKTVSFDLSSPTTIDSDGGYLQPHYVFEYNTGTLIYKLDYTWLYINGYGIIVGPECNSTITLSE